ncbi:MAG: hypothetical protein Q4F83_16535 [Eubacteriales bacterium]|nr:hypothetical protein [Eubacteriales bacterium]
MERYRDKLWFSAGLNVLALGVLFLLMGPVYDTDKEAYMLALVNGALGKNDPHIIFGNCILGKIYSILYGIFGARFCWYDMFQCALLFAAFTALTYIMIQKWKSDEGVWISLILLAVCGYECYIKMSYIKTAGVAAAAGILLIVYGASRIKYARIITGMGILLSFAGSLYDFKMFMCGALLILPVCIMVFLNHDNPEQRKKRHSACCVLTALIVLMLVSCGALFADRMVYQKNESWQKFAEYNEVRDELIARGFPEYQKNKELYEELGIDKKTYRLYQKGALYDPEKLSTDTLKRLLEQSKADGSKEAATGSLRRFVTDSVHSMTFCVFIFAVLLWIISKKKKLFCRAVGIAELILWLVFSLLAFGKGAGSETQELLRMIGIIAYLMAMFENSIVIDRQICAALLAGVLVTGQYSWKENWRTDSNEDTATRVFWQQTLGTIAADREHLYLAMPGAIKYEKIFKVFDSVPTEIMGNNCPLDSWIAASPACVEIMEKFGVNNPLRDIVGNPLIYLVDDNIEQTLEYIHAYYDKDAKAAVVKQIGEVKIYQIN